MSKVIINGRYLLHESLGQGGMGIVYRATDRLIGQTVALKQVSVDPKLLKLTAQSKAETEQLFRLALAKEFQLLASLRHPHIVSVLDYGFDESQQPYFAMDYLPQAQTLLEAGKDQPPAHQFLLLQQLLQALAYLHRHSILHQDLKPQNILVSQGTVHVLDFGLASSDTANHSNSAGGTPFYLPPEVWEKQSYSQAADLYAIGILAYQLLAGAHPFAPLDHTFVNRVMEAEPDWQRLNTTEEVTQVIARLLAKTPTARYHSAQAALTALAQATNQPITETAAIRESYLQTATFVGRETELTQLQTALAEAKNGNGSLWLIGGESGVGKSRLLNELRTLALVDGFQVLRGQAIAEGGSPYHVWRDLVLHLALHAPLSELEAGILKEFQPRLAQIVEHPIPNAPTLEGNSQHQRFIFTLVDLVQRQPQPTLLLLEDMQWAHESIEPLKQLLPLLKEQTLLIVASFRSDECPDLPAKLGKQAQLITLTRLGQKDIGQLVEAMLGEMAQNSNIVTQLFKETEGNIFFLVETLRAWAEEAGSLLTVAQTTVPQPVLTGGMQQIIRRRLDKVPDPYRPLLKLAAIAGRQLDLNILSLLKGTIALPAWLLAGSEAMVLEVQANRWQFAHDKLREALLQDLTATEKQAGHKQVAIALETVYKETGTLAIILAEHWREANEPTKEIHYTTIACEQLLWSGEYNEAAHLSKYLLNNYNSRLSNTIRLNLWQILGFAYKEMDKYSEAQAIYQTGVDTARLVNDQKAIIQHLIGLGESIWRALQYEKQWHNKERITTSKDCFQEALSLAESIDDKNGIAACWHNMGILLSAHYHNFQAALQYIQWALTSYQQVDNQDKMIATMSDLAFTLIHVNKGAKAKRYLTKALTMAQHTGTPRMLPYIHEMLALLAMLEGNWATIGQHIDVLWRFAKDPQGLFYPITNHLAAMHAFHQHDYHSTQRYIDLNLAQYEHHPEQDYAFTWCLQGAVAIMQEDLSLLAISVTRGISRIDKALVSQMAYVALLTAGHYLLTNQIKQAVTWLVLGETHLATSPQPIEEFTGHVTDVAAQLREKFQDTLQTVAPQIESIQAQPLTLATIIDKWDESMRQQLINGKQIVEAIEQTLFTA